MGGGKHDNAQAWSPKEDVLILKLTSDVGNKWVDIVKDLPGRTVSSVRNRYQRIQKGLKIREEGGRAKNMCHACGQLKLGHICSAIEKNKNSMNLPVLESGRTYRYSSEKDLFYECQLSDAEIQADFDKWTTPFMEYDSFEDENENVAVQPPPSLSHHA